MSSFILRYFLQKPKEFIGRQTDHRWWDLGLPSGFMGRIWQPGDHISAALWLRQVGTYQECPSVILGKKAFDEFTHMMLIHFCVKCIKLQCELTYAWGHTNASVNWVIMITVGSGNGLWPGAPFTNRQATGLDAWASRVKCPARFVSHLHEISMYIWVVYSLCFFCCLFITVTWWYVWCIEWASGNQEEVQACLVTLWLFIISYYSLYKTTLGLLCSWFENNPHFHKYSVDFHV